MNEFNDLNVGKILEDTDLEIELQSPDDEYTLIYSTIKIAKEIEEPTQFSRNYWLLVHSNKSRIDAPWDRYVYQNQKTLIENIIKFSKYKITRVSKGWTVTCNICGNKIAGKIWRNSPKNCEARIEKNKCEGELINFEYVPY